ncbi:MAG TPA: GNAT family N-acetyltransferase [Candidatus Paceibacterota bacterium]
MKIITSEFAHSYRHFSFGYADFLLHEKGDSLHKIYERGFLPDSSVPEHSNLFYRARSARVKLHGWTPNSENRRVLQKFEGKLQKKNIPFGLFNHDDKAFRSFCLTYFKNRHGEMSMPEQKFDTIMKSNLIKNIIVYYENNNIVAYVFEVNDSTMGHYWYSFYDLSYAFQSLGMWIMIDGVREAKKEKKKYYYLGTVYGDKALYKTNFNNLEYWTGSAWSDDIKALKKRSRGDNERTFDLPAEWKEQFHKKNS